MAGVLVVGGGGREQAIAQAMSVSNEVSRVVVHNEAEIGLRAFSGREKPFVVIGPEAPLVAGLADDLRAEGYTVFGASKEASQFEAKKSRTIRLARRTGVVHPATFIAEGVWMQSAARAFVEDVEPSDYVIKADGLGGGKAVVIPSTRDEARNVVEDMIHGGYDGSGTDIINFAKRKKGPEVSAMVVVGMGKDDFIILPLSQDHKRLRYGDKGPNTGGVGAYSPLPEHIVNQAQYKKIWAKAYDLLAGMEAEGVIYEQAVMYMGLMMSDDLTDDESDLLEINVRFGDPESQVIFPPLQHAGVDVYRLLRSAAERDLEKPSVDFSKLGYAALSVCLVSDGYPGKPRKGDVIFGLENTYQNVSIQRAGVTENTSGRPITNGGRVLYVTGVGETIDEAADWAYAAIGEQAIHFADYQYRKDIGWQSRRAV